MTREEVLPICNPCVSVGRYHLGTTETTYQEDNRHVQHERNNGVGQQREDTDVVHVVHGEVGNLEEQSSDTVHDSADGSEVVQGNQRVHLELSGAQQTLNHDQTDGLEDDTTELEEETDQDEPDLTERGDDDTNDDGGDVHQDLEVHGSNSHSPGGREHSDGHGGLVVMLALLPFLRRVAVLLFWFPAYLEHLNESNTQVEIRNVTADQTQTEEETDGDDGTQIDTASHLDGLAAIEQGGGAGENLGHEGCKCQVPCCKNNRWRQVNTVISSMGRSIREVHIRKPILIVVSVESL